MKSVVIDEFGGADRLRLTDSDPLNPGPDEVVLQVCACAVNHLDVDIREGVSRFPLGFPLTLGLEAIGRIERVGRNVTGWQIGDRVMPQLINTCGRCEYCRSGRESLCNNGQFIGMFYPGAYAEQLVCSAKQLIPLPDSIDDDSAAALQISFSTAWHMLFTRAGLQPAETVLINSVGSGVGSAALQLAKLAGATVIGTASTRQKLEQAAAFGLDYGVQYNATDPVADVMEITHGRGVDLALEHVGGKAFENSLESLRKGGRLVTCGAHSGEVVPLDVIPLFRGEHTILGSFVYTENETRKVLRLAEQGRIRPVIDSVYPLTDAKQAMERLESRSAFGKVIIRPRPASNDTI